MDEVSKWVFTICCGTLLCGVVSVLIPSKSMEKIMSLVLGLFMLCCFLVPPKGKLPELQGGMLDAQSSQSQAAQEVKDYFVADTLEKSRGEILKIILKQLSEYGIKEKDIQIYIETEESTDGGNQVLAVNITLPPRMRENHDLIHKTLEYELGLTVRLEYNGEEP